MSLLSVQNVTRTFGGLIAVNNVSFEVQQGEIFGLIGPNGAGKTTLFNLITALTPVTSGAVHFNSKQINTLKPHQIARLGVARTFQNIRLFGKLTALQNVMVAHHIHTHADLLTGVFGLPKARREEKWVRQSAEELLGRVGLLDRADERAVNFSYGDQRRLEIARALALKPALLLLDEPGAGMNIHEKNELIAFVREVRQNFNLTIVLIEHHVPMVMNLCDRIAVLNFGSLIALGNPYEVQNNPAVIEAYLGETEL